MDLYFVLMLALTYLFGCFLHFYSSENTLQFILLFNLLYLLLIITYFSSVVASLICCMLYVFGYGSFILYRVVTGTQTVSTDAYVWLLAVPLLCIPFAFYRTFLAEIQHEVASSAQKEAEFSGFDAGTRNLNSNIFYYYLPRFMSMAHRGYIKLTLFAIRLRYYQEILQIVGKEGVEQLYREIGTSIDEASRAEDIPYFMEDGRFMLIAITDAKGGAILKERVKESLNSVYLRDRLRRYHLAVDVQIGMAEYDGSQSDSLALEAQAEKDMEFDV